MPRRARHHPVRFQPQRRFPEGRFREYYVVCPEAVCAALLVKQSGPAERPKHLYVRGIAFGIVPPRRDQKRSNPDHERGEKDEKFAQCSPSQCSDFQTRLP